MMEDKRKRLPPDNSRHIVLVDIDHTLSNSFWRDHLLGDWEAYYEQQSKDEPLGDMVLMVNCLAAQGYTMVGLTARPDKYRVDTAAWLLTHGVMLDHLLMRPGTDHQRSPPCKIATVVDALGKDFAEKIAFIIDDREDVCQAFSALGITSLLVTSRRGR